MKHQQQPEKVPSNLKLVLSLSALLVIVLLSQQSSSNKYNKQQQQSLSSSSISLLAPPTNGGNDNNGVKVDDENNNNTTQATSSSQSTTTTTTTTTITPSSQSSSLLSKQQQQQEQNKPPRLFTCGFDLWNFGTELFGDLRHVGRFGEIEISPDEQPQEQDILLQGGLNGPCHKSPQDDFPGKILFVNSEAHSNIGNKYLLKDRFFQLGPIVGGGIDVIAPSSSSSEKRRALPMVSFGAIFFVSSTTLEQRQWILDPTKRPQGLLEKKRNAIVFVVNRCGGIRKEAAMELSQVATIHQNPKCNKKKSLLPNNMQPIPKQDWTPRNDYRYNYRLYGKYKYCLVMENTFDVPNYITEKIFLAFLGGCLPIYAGNPQTALSIFHKDAFVMLDPQNPEPAMQELQYLQSNHTAYQEKMTHSILCKGAAEEYLSLAQDVGNGQLRSRIRSMMMLDNNNGMNHRQ